MKTLLILLMGLTFMVGCATTDTQDTAEATDAEEGFLEGYYDRLESGPEGGAQLRWLKPGVDFGKYEKVMLDSVIFYLADDSEFKGIDGNEMKELTDAFNLAMVNALKDKYPIVAEPGPDVLQVKVAITDLKQSRPALSAVTSVVPIGLGISLIKKEATGAWTGSGTTGVEVLGVDTISNDVVGAAQDQQTAGFTERFSKWGSAEEAFEFWAKRLRLFLDNAQEIET
jgi:hypothetical protein